MAHTIKDRILDNVEYYIKYVFPMDVTVRTIALYLLVNLFLHPYLPSVFDTISILQSMILSVTLVPRIAIKNYTLVTDLDESENKTFYIFTGKFMIILASVIISVVTYVIYHILTAIGFDYETAIFDNVYRLAEFFALIAAVFIDYDIVFEPYDTEENVVANDIE